jgi:drug/metabolite transporter (DMT)-like permease
MGMPRQAQGVQRQNRATILRHRMNPKGLFYGSLASLCFGASLVVNKVGLAQSALHPLEYTALSVIVAGLLGGVLIAPKTAALWSCSRLCWLNMLFLGVTASALSYVLLFWGQSLTKAINAGFLSALSGFFTMIFASLLLKEVVEKRKYAFILLLFAGIYLFTVGTDILQFNQGDLLIIIAAMILGLTNVLSKFAMDELHGELVASMRLIVGAAVLLGILLVRSPHVLTSVADLPAWFVVSGVLMWGFIVCLYRAIEISGATMATFVLTSYPIVSATGAVLFLNEVLAVQHIVGGILILLSIYKLVGE